MGAAGEGTGMSVLARLVGSILELPGLFVDVAAQGPLEAILVLFGALFVGVAAGVFGLLALGAVVEFLTPSRSSTPRRPAE